MNGSFMDAVESISQEQGWSDQTTGDLALRYLDDHADADERQKFVAFLLDVQREENGEDEDPALMCGNCRDAVTQEPGGVLVGSDGETHCPDTDRPHGPAVIDDTDEEDASE